MLIGKYEKNSLSQLILRQHPHQLVPGLSDTLPEKRNIKQVRPQSRRVSPVVAVHDEDESLGVLEVVSPEGSDLVLATHVPDCEADVFVFYCLHIESYRERERQSEGEEKTTFPGNLTDGWNGGHDFSQF